MKSMGLEHTSPPGTVSKLLWHFTGGPKWIKREQRQAAERKPAGTAYNALVSILKSRELRLGGYAEIARVTLPVHRYFDLATRKTIEKKNTRVVIKSVPMCCVADIPIAHLSFHANRYGKFAIAFHRDAVVNRGFNPVLYTLDDTGVIRSLYAGMTRLSEVDTVSLELNAGDVESWVNDLDCDAAADIGAAASFLWSEATDIREAVNAARRSFRRLLAFVKTFTRDEFQSIYCEREWRSLEPFTFTYDDIAMIVLPRLIGRNRYFERFLKSSILRRIPRGIPIVPWEDLIEH